MADSAVHVHSFNESLYSIVRRDDEYTTVGDWVDSTTSASNGTS